MLQQQHEFVTTGTSHGVFGTCDGKQSAGNEFEQGITHTVAQGFVDDLEAVQIEHRHGKGPLLGHGLLQSIGEQHTIGESGEAVVRCLMPQLRMDALQ